MNEQDVKCCPTCGTALHLGECQKCLSLPVVYMLCHRCGTGMGRWSANTFGCQSCGARVTIPDEAGQIKQPDPVNPSHYVKGGIEVRHVIRAFECTYNVGTAVAYLLRAPFKANYVEDIRKAIQHLQFELEDKK